MAGANIVGFTVVVCLVNTSRGKILASSNLTFWLCKWMNTFFPVASKGEPSWRVSVLHSPNGGLYSDFT